MATVWLVGLGAICCTVIAFLALAYLIALLTAGRSEDD